MEKGLDFEFDNENPFRSGLLINRSRTTNPNHRWLDQNPRKKKIYLSPFNSKKIKIKTKGEKERSFQPNPEQPMSLSFSPSQSKDSHLLAHSLLQYKGHWKEEEEENEKKEIRKKKTQTLFYLGNRNLKKQRVFLRINGYLILTV